MMLCVACHDGSSDAAVASPANGAASAAAPAVAPEQQLMEDLDGVWSTADDPEGSGDETVYIVRHEGETLRMFVGGEEWPLSVDDVDVDAGTIALVRGAGAARQVVTLRKIPAADKPEGGHFLRITFDNGQYRELGFVRRISPADLQRIAEIRGHGGKVETSGSPGLSDDQIDCGSPKTYRQGQLCADPAVLAKENALGRYFAILIEEKHVDIASTQAAARRQLDDCRTRQCLMSAYDQWLDYLDENYNGIIAR